MKTAHIDEYTEYSYTCPCCEAFTDCGECQPNTGEIECENCGETFYLKN